MKIPLERAVDDNKSRIVYYFVKEYNQDISTLHQVATYNYVATYVLRICEYV